MKHLIIIFFLASCGHSNGIHNDSIVDRHKTMLKEDKRMKKAMQKHRSKSKPKQHGVKTKHKNKFVR